MIYSILGAVAIIVIAVAIMIPLLFRRVVETNEVHIVQTANKTILNGYAIKAVRLKSLYLILKNLFIKIASITPLKRYSIKVKTMILAWNFKNTQNGCL